jgi:transposase
MTSIAYIGIDAHEETLAICVLGETGLDPINRFTVSNDPNEIRRAFNRLRSQYDLHCCYEASCCGYVLQRQLKGMSIACDVIAPSLVPKRPGDRVKTDRRDARKLAEHYRAGQLTVVHPPTLAEESARRVTRLREQIVRDVVESKNELNRFLSGIGRRFPGKKRWTQAYWKWLGEQDFDDADQYVFTELVAMVKFKVSRLEEVNRKVMELAGSPIYKDRVALLCCLRGIGPVTAMTLITEIIDFNRFPSARSLMVYLGLVTSENSSGNSQHKGGITKAGNAHCRRVLVEASWKNAHRPAVCKALKARQEGQPATVIAHSWKAQLRLNKKFKSVASRRPRPVAAVATARELVGFIWSIMTTPVAAV